MSDSAKPDDDIVIDEVLILDGPETKVRCYPPPMK